MPVSTKKELFHASLLPLVVHANTLVMDRREKIADSDKRLARGQTLSTDELAKLQDMEVLLRIEPPYEGAKLRMDIEAMRKSGELQAVFDRMRLE